MRLSSPLSVRTTVTEHSAWVSVTGELDVATTPELTHAVSTCLHHGPESLALDVRNVSLCDCSGLSGLLRARGQARRARVRFRLLGARPQLSTLLAATGTAPLFQEDGQSDQPIATGRARKENGRPASRRTAAETGHRRRGRPTEAGV